MDAQVWSDLRTRIDDWGEMMIWDLQGQLLGRHLRILLLYNFKRILWVMREFLEQSVVLRKKAKEICNRNLLIRGRGFLTENLIWVMEKETLRTWKHWEIFTRPRKSWEVFSKQSSSTNFPLLKMQRETSNRLESTNQNREAADSH